MTLAKFISEIGFYRNGEFRFSVNWDTGDGIEQKIFNRTADIVDEFGECEMATAYKMTVSALGEVDLYIKDPSNICK